MICDPSGRKSVISVYAGYIIWYITIVIYNNILYCIYGLPSIMLCDPSPYVIHLEDRKHFLSNVYDLRSRTDACERVDAGWGSPKVRAWRSLVQHLIHLALKIDPILC